jgi:hypothetical protein
MWNRLLRELAVVTVMFVARELVKQLRRGR